MEVPHTRRSSFTASTDLPSASSYSRLRMRRNLFSQSVKYAQREGAEYENILHSAAPTDPLGMECDIRLENENGQAEEYDIQMCNPPRERWGGGHYFLFASFCDSLTFGTLSVFPLLHFGQEYLGQSLIIPFFIAWIFCVMPLLALEHSLGQIWQGGVGKVFTMVSERSRVVGLLALILILLNMPSYSRMLGELLLYLVKSIGRVLPWQVSVEMLQTCHNTTDVALCNSYSFCTTCANETKCFATFYKHAETVYNNTVIGPLPSGNSVVAVNWPLVGASVCSLIIVAILVACGLRLFGQLATFSGVAILIYLFFTTIFTSGLQGVHVSLSDIILKGVHSASASSWFQVFRLVFSTAGIVVGSQYTLASYNSISTNVVPFSALVTVLRIGCSVLAGLVVISLVSSSHHKVSAVTTTIEFPLDDTGAFWLFGSKQWCSNSSYLERWRLDFASVNSVLFITYPVCLGLLTAAPVHSILFYFMLFFSAVITVVTLFFTILTFIHDTEGFQFVGKKKMIAIVFAIWVSASFPFFLNYKEQTGRGLTDSLNTIMREMGLPFVGLCEVIAILLGGGWAAQTKKVGWKAPSVLLAFFALSICASLVFIFTNAVPRIDWFCSVLPLLTIVAAIPITLLFATGRRSFWPRVLHTVVGDAETVRRQINSIICGSPLHLPLLWSFCLKLFVPTCFIVSFVTYFMTSKFPLLNIASLVVFLCLSVLLAWGFLFPQHWHWLKPSKQNRWTYSDLPHKTKVERFSLRRKTFHFWEEFESPSSLWDRASVLEYKNR